MHKCHSVYMEAGGQIEMLGLVFHFEAGSLFVTSRPSSFGGSFYPSISVFHLSV